MADSHQNGKKLCSRRPRKYTLARCLNRQSTLAATPANLGSRSFKTVKTKPRVLFHASPRLEALTCKKS
jgi:hypothetical protein